MEKRAGVVGCYTVSLGFTGLGSEPFVKCFDVRELDPFGVVCKALIVEHISDFINVRRPGFAGESRGDVVQSKRGGHCWLVALIRGINIYTQALESIHVMADY